MRYLIILYSITLCSICLSSCGETISSYGEKDAYANIYPLYEGTYIPYNIAPLNFRIRENGDKYLVRFIAGKDSFDVSTKSDTDIPIKRWKKLLDQNKGDQLLMKIFSCENRVWTKYKELVFHIAPEAIDPYVAYRLIEPGYESWFEMGLYQRNLESFDETPIFENAFTNNNCMNCHSFCNHNPEMMLFHMRAIHGGTIMKNEDDIKKIDMKTSWMPSAGVYPRWNPDGRFIAFSTNKTKQGFHSSLENKVEVFDSESDIVIYDTQENVIFTDSLIFSKDSFETFPEWSPDGKYLYFCSSTAINMPKNYDSLKYDLLRISFDPETKTFGSKVDTLISSVETNKSAVMPRISPDGKHLVCCMSDFGTFPIWHRENDLYVLNMENMQLTNMDKANSCESDSYHAWSSNGKWMIFSSRRMDGNYTRLYISYFDEKGVAQKAFLLPQKKPLYYDFLLKSYNIPELITGKVKTSAYAFENIAKKNAKSLSN